MDTHIEEDLINAVQRTMTEFAKSTYTDRFPDARDGLKMVVRRILYAMHILHITNKSTTVKCAKIVGAVIGDFHPHGDISTYQALVALAQPFTLNYPLINPQGNFGNILGDGAAAQRYTEANFTKYGYEVLINNLNDEIVEYNPNYDGLTKEPSVLPSRVPNLLINGSYGIGGAAYASSIPPHNLSDIVAITMRLLKDPSIPCDELVAELLPDFPFGGIITNPEDITKFYKYGTPAKIKMTSVYTIDEKERIIHITELPYLVDGRSLYDDIIQKYPKLKDVGIENIILGCNETSLDLAIYYGKTTNPHKLIERILKDTKATSSAPLILSCIIDDKLMVDCTIKDILVEWIRFRRETVQKIIAKRIQEIYRETHILQAQIDSYERIVEIIAIAQSSLNKDVVVQTLIDTFKFSIIQATAIASMKIYDLTKNSKETLIATHTQLENELLEKKAKMNPEAIDSLIIEDLTYIVKTYGKPKRTKYQGETRKEKTVKKQTCGDVIIARISGQNEPYFIRKEGLLKHKNLPKITSIGRLKYVNKLIRYNPDLDYLFAVSNLGNVYKVLDIASFMESSVITQDHWSICHNCAPPRLQECFIDYLAIPKAKLEAGYGNILVFFENGFMRRLSITTVPQRTPKTGSSIIIAKDGKNRDVVCDAYYLDPDEGEYLLYGLPIGNIHLFPLGMLRMGSRVQGNVPLSVSQNTAITPQCVNITGTCVLVRESGECKTIPMDAIPQKPYKRLSYSAWRIRKRDPLIYTGPLRKGLLAVSGLGELEYKSSNEVTTPFSLKKIAAILPL